MTRTIYNCTLIQKNVRAGLGEPYRWYNIERCEGYSKKESEEELCEECKK